MKCLSPFSHPQEDHGTNRIANFSAFRKEDICEPGDAERMQKVADRIRVLLICIIECGKLFRKDSYWRPPPGPPRRRFPPGRLALLGPVAARVLVACSIILFRIASSCGLVEEVSDFFAPLPAPSAPS